MTQTEKVLDAQTDSVEMLVATLREVRRFIADNSIAGGPSITPILNKIDKAINEA